MCSIVFLTAAAFYLFFGLGQALNGYTADPGNLEKRAMFYVQRNRVRDLSFLMWLLYSAIMEKSAFQGTFGKVLLSVRVADKSGKGITFGRSIGRNLGKIISYVFLGLGFLWVAFAKEKRGWHDIIARTYVISRTSEVDANDQMSAESAA